MPKFPLTPYATGPYNGFLFQKTPALSNFMLVHYPATALNPYLREFSMPATAHQTIIDSGPVPDTN